MVKRSGPEVNQITRGVLAYCRVGFEAECAAELQAKLSSLGITAEFGEGTPTTSGFVAVDFAEASSKSRDAMQKLDISDCIFSRQIVFYMKRIGDLPDKDRLGPIVKWLTAKNLGFEFNEVFVEAPDTDRDDDLIRFCSTFQRPLFKALTKLKLYDESKNESELRLHVFFPNYDEVYLGVSIIENSSPWRMGIPRLHNPGKAPSRSALKLEEAFKVLLTDEERQKFLRSGLHVVDLGAAPGGWTYLFTQREIFVTAVDNAKMDADLMKCGMVNHVPGDAFKYRPKEPVEWMVCDVVEQPKRITELVIQWFEKRNCRRCIFNLKLPMKKRYEEVHRDLQRLDQALAKLPGRYDLRCKQLYHDRREVTVYVGKA